MKTKNREKLKTLKSKIAICMVTILLISLLAACSGGTIGKSDNESVTLTTDKAIDRDKKVGDAGVENSKKTSPVGDGSSEKGTQGGTETGSSEKTGTTGLGTGTGTGSPEKATSAGTGSSENGTQGGRAKGTAEKSGATGKGTGTGNSQKAGTKGTISTSQSTQKAAENNANSVNMTIKTTDKTILKSTSITIEENQSVFDLLKSYTKKEKLHMDFTGAGKQIYITAIDNIYEFDLGPESGWIFKVNGEIIDTSCSAYTLENGDRVEWIFTKDLGKSEGR